MANIKEKVKKYKIDKEEDRNYKKKQKEDEKKMKEKPVSCAAEPPMPIIPWVRHDLRVRIIDKKYAKGAYYKQKVSIQ